MRTGLSYFSSEAVGAIRLILRILIGYKDNPVKKEQSQLFLLDGC